MACRQRVARVVDGNVERLRVGAELMALQVAPFVAHGAQCSLLSVVHDLDLFGQRCLVIHEERDEHVVLRQLVGHLRVGPDGGLHLAAVDATEAREVYQHRFAQCLGGGHAGLVVGVFGLHGLGVEVEVLGVDGRREGADGLAGRAPEARYHVDGEGQGAQSQHDGRHGHGLPQVAANLVGPELEPSDEVAAQCQEDDNPQAEEHFAIHQVPAVGQVGHAQELQGERQFDEAEDNLDLIHPRTALGALLH